METLTLISGELEIVVLPDLGGAIAEVFFKGKQVMGRPPKKSIDPVPLGDEADWVRAWNGGWQPLLPNAGREYLIGKYPQGFHGNASQAKWSVESSSATEVLLSWHDEELQSYRSINLSSDQIVVSGRLVNLSSESRPFNLTEHVIFGDSLLDSEVRLLINDQAQFMELSYDGSAQGAEFYPWSEKSKSDWSVVSSETHARMGLLSHVDSSGIQIVGEKIEATLTWDRENLPYVWIWEEMGSTQTDPWNGDYFCLGVEPSTAPHGAGLGESLRTGTANTLGPKERFHWWVALKLASTSTKE